MVVRDTRMSDIFQIIQVVVGGISTVALAYISYLTFKVKLASEAAAIKADEVKTDLKKSNAAVTDALASNSRTLDTIHTNTNSLVEKLEDAAFERGRESKSPPEER
jgi:flagellar basal body-associated protein FliL